MSCDIILASYNGAPFVDDLMKSLITQTYNEFRLIVRDDGSTDGTIDIIHQYKSSIGDRMIVLDDRTPTGSAKGNFSKLLEQVDADYVFFADIDDVWLPNKLDVMLNRMRLLESNVGQHTPIYLFSDAKAVRKDLTTISDSYWAYKRISPTICRSLNKLLICPPMLGCTSAINRSLVPLITPVPDGVTGHDWWAIIVCALFGIVDYIEDKTILYRLHGENASMQRRVDSLEYIRQSDKITRVRRGLSRRIDQANEVILRYSEDISKEQLDTLRRFSALSGQGWLRRRFELISGGYVYPDLLRTISTLFAM